MYPVETHPGNRSFLHSRTYPSAKNCIPEDNTVQHLPFPDRYRSGTHLPRESLPDCFAIFLSFPEKTTPRLRFSGFYKITVKHFDDDCKEGLKISISMLQFVLLFTPNQ